MGQTYAELLAQARGQTSAPKKKSLWERANTPLTDIFSRGSKKISNLRVFDPEEDDSWLTTRLKGFGQGAIEATGDLADSFTSPVGLALSASGLTGLSSSARAVQGARRVQQALGAAGVAHGGSRVFTGLKEGNYGEAGAGALEAGLSGMGLHPKFLPGGVKPPVSGAPKVNIPDPHFIPRELRVRAQAAGMTDDIMKGKTAEQVAQATRVLERNRKVMGTTPPPPKVKQYTSMSNKRLRELGRQGDKDALAEISARAKAPKSKFETTSPAAKGKGVDFEGPSMDRYGRGNIIHRKTGNPRFDDAYENWVNVRRASNIQGILKRKEFSDLDGEGLGGIIRYQDGAREGRFGDVQKYFDDMHKTLSEKLGGFNFKDKYLPQLWDDPADDVTKAFRRVGVKPNFTLPSVIENYRAGIAMGLTPKYKNISELMGWYEKTASKAIADADFFKMLKDKGWIRPKNRAGKDWESLNPDHFPVYLSDYGQQVYMAPKPVAQAVNNYLSPGHEFFQWLGDKASITKNIVLSSGLPKTAINAHGFNIAARALMGGGVKEFGRSLKYMVRPKKAGDWLEDNLADAPDAIKHGLMITTEDHLFGSPGSVHLLREPKTKVGEVANKGMNWLLGKHAKYFEDPLFQNMVPALKLQHYKGLSQQLLKSGMDERAAKRQAAQATNAVYGGINWEEMMRSRDLQNVMRSVLIAPDWFETQYRIGKGLTKSMQDPNNPAAQQYKKIAANLIGAYVSMNVVNYAINGHFSFQNPSGHAMDIKIGSAGGKDRYIRPLGTAADFFRLPVDTLASMVQGDLSAPGKVMKNRRSTLAKLASNVYSNQDDFGRPLGGKDNFGRPQPLLTQFGNYGAEIADIATPAYLSGGLDFARGRAKSVEEAILGSIELPVRYANPPGRQQAKPKRRPYRPRIR